MEKFSICRELLLVKMNAFSESLFESIAPQFVGPSRRDEPPKAPNFNSPARQTQNANAARRKHWRLMSPEWRQRSKSKT